MDVRVSLVVVMCVVAIAWYSQVSVSVPLKQRGTFADAACDDATVYTNVDALRSLLDRLVQSNSFRYFLVNLESDCPYWAAQVICTSAENPCGVCECDPSAVPSRLKTTLLELLSTHNSALAECSAPSAHHQAPPSDAVRRTLRDDLVTDVAAAGGQPVWVDLVENPESNTGYVGELASKVWESIYRENCALNGQQESTLHAAAEQQQDDSSSVQRADHDFLCSELHVFFKIISGLHASISTHIAVHYQKSCTGDIKDPVRHVSIPSFSANESELHRRVLQHPDRLSNLLFLYKMILRAVAVVHEREGFLVDGAEVSAADEQLLRTVLETPLLRAATAHKVQDQFSRQMFDEALFTDLVRDAGANDWTPAALARMLRNVASYMNCLTCEKCRLWGKLQTTGLAAALRVLFFSPNVVDGGARLLDDRDKIALLNLLRQLTVSVSEVRKRLTLNESRICEID